MAHDRAYVAAHGRIQRPDLDVVRDPLEDQARQYPDAHPALDHRHHSVIVPGHELHVRLHPRIVEDRADYRLPAFLQEHERISAHLLRRDPAVLGEGVAFRQDGHHLVVRDGYGVQSVRGGRYAGERHVDPAFQHPSFQLVVVSGQELVADARAVFPQPLYRRREPMRRHARERPDPEAAGASAGQLLHAGIQGGGRYADVPGVLEHRFPFRGYRGASAPPVEQPQSPVRFQVGQHPADARLAYAEGIRCLGEASAVCHCNERPQLDQADVGHPIRPSSISIRFPYKISIIHSDY